MAICYSLNRKCYKPYLEAVSVKSTKLKCTLLKSIKDFNPKLPSYSTIALVPFPVLTAISGTTTCSFPNPIDTSGTR